MRALLSEDRLDLLRQLDHERKWYSLDDKRICSVCDRIFTGRQIDFDRDQRGRYHLHCPTPGCPAQVRHWFLCETSLSALAPLTETGEAIFFTPHFGHG